MKIYPRKITKKIEKFLKIPEIIVIHGARQTGKTTILSVLKRKIKSEKGTDNVFYFDLEDFELLDLCNQGAKEVIEYLEGQKANFKNKVFLLIDEIQYLENPSSFLKYFFDHYKDRVKLIVSGSSSFVIKRKFKDSLVGRTVDFELFGLDFEEFLTFKETKYDLNSQNQIVIKEIGKLFLEYTFYGSYPRIVLEKSLEVKERLLKQIISTYLKKDIKDLSDITDVTKFNKLLKILASQSGSLLNVLEISNTIGLSRQTIENYLMILENTYVIKLITPFYNNIRSEITKTPKIYFEDTGLRSIIARGSFPKLLEGQDFEGAVYNVLRKKFISENIHFWRTRQKEEIDFVIEKNGKLLVYESKINIRNKDNRILLSFKKRYPRSSYYLTGIAFKDKQIDPKINFIYPWQI